MGMTNSPWAGRAWSDRPRASPWVWEHPLLPLPQHGPCCVTVCKCVPLSEPDQQAPSQQRLAQAPPVSLACKPHTL